VVSLELAKIHVDDSAEGKEVFYELLGIDPNDGCNKLRIKH
jgi:hypothetical protein